MTSLNVNFKKYLSLLILIILLFFFSIYIKNFKLDASSDTLILQNDDDFSYFSYYNEIFPDKNFLVLAIKSNEVIDDKYISKINEVKKLLENIDQIESTFSIVDAPILISNNMKLEDLSNLEIKNINDNIIELDKVLNEFSESPIFKDQLISKDKKTSSIIIYPKINKDYIKLKKERDKIINENKELFNIINKKYRIEKEKFNKERHDLVVKIRSEIKKANIPYEHFLGGIDMIADDTIQFIKKDISTFSITVSVFLIFILFIIFREIKWVLISLATTFYAIIFMIGLTGFLTWEITAISANFISLMLILSISMNIHIINYHRLNHNPLSLSIYQTFKNMFFPCLYTALTTIVAFGSLIFSDIKPVIDFGKIMITALLVIFATSFTVLPLLISFFPKIKINKNNNMQYLILIFKKIYEHKIKIILINLIIFIVSIFGILNLNVENSFINYFKKNTEIYKGMTLIDKNLGGTTPLDIIITFKKEIIESEISNEEDLDIDLELDGDLGISFEESEVWFTQEKINIIREIHNYLENRQEIGKVQSIDSLIRVAEMINKKTLTPFELEIIYEKIPENYKNDLISPFLSIDKNMIKIRTRIKDSEEIKRDLLIKEISNYLSEKYDLIEEIKVNGLLVLYNNMLQSLFSSQVKSFGIVLILIYFMFLILFSSFKLSIVGILPNVFASTFILGLIGILKIPLDIMTITIAAITIGIAVDNTIHYLYRFRKNMSINDKLSSLNKTHDSVGQAVLTTSITIAFGFSVLILSNFIPTILFGVFTALAMIIAMLGVMITLPVLINLFYKN